MKELHDIIKAYEAAEQSGSSAVLATLVKVKGSHYRQPGAKMLMTGDGSTAGILSGGCLEADLLEHARNVIESGQAVVVTYDTSSDDDIVWGLGLGCGGQVHILVEPVPQGDRRSPIEFLKRCLNGRQFGAIATVIGLEGNLKAQIGDHVMLSDDGTVTANVDNSALLEAIRNDAKKAIRTHQSSGKSYKLTSGAAEVFIDSIRPPVSLAVFGAGNDAVPLVSFAGELGWYTTIIDHRPAYSTAQRFPAADSVVNCSPEDIREEVQLDGFSAAVILTHNFHDDLELLKMLLPTSIEYVGLLGSRQRTKQLLEELKVQGITLTEEQRRSLHSPVGIDIGAETPGEVALSIVAEIQAVLSHRSGGLLRDGEGAIHGLN